MKSMLLAAIAASVFVASGASAAPVVDGNLTPAEYAGALVTTVTQAPGVNPATQLPSNPGPNVENVSYTVYFTSDATNVYVGLQSIGSSNGLAFANLYFDTNNATAAGSDIGFETPGGRIFVPATGAISGSTLASLGITAVASTGLNDTVEVKIPWTVFTTNAAGLGQPLVAPGGQLQLRTIQAFNYAGATGDGVDLGAIPRFGFQTAPAAVAGVPEPATWGMMIAGFGLVGGTMRRRRTSVAFG